MKQQQIKIENDEKEEKHLAAQLLRKYLNKLNGKNESWLVSQIREVCESRERERKTHSFCFENSHQAADWNAKVLNSYDNDYTLAIKDHKDTILEPGSEFRKINQIEKIWQYRDNWNAIENTLKNGCIYPLKKTPDEVTRLKDLQAMIDRGNHKSSHVPHLAKCLDENIEKEVRKGFLIPLPVKYLKHLKNAVVIPMGMNEQYSINELGEKIMKSRPCHGASFPTPSGCSVNKDHDKQLLSKCRYDQCLQRVIHSVHRLRLAHKTTAILLFKYDFDAAYRRIHVLPLHAVTTIIIVKRLAYLLSRLPFGATCGPSKYSDVSEAIFDMANDLINDETWDPDTLRSPHADKLQKLEYLSNEITFCEAKELEVEVLLREIACDGYIDDSITVALDKDKY